MASNVRCIFYLLLAISFCFETQARDSKLFSKVTKVNEESITISPTQAPMLAPSPSPEPEVVEHGYGLYGQEETYQNKFEYPPTTTNPTKTEKLGEEKFVPAEELSKNNFKEFGMGYSNDNFNGNGNGNGNEKQGMSDTRFLENGKYYYDVDQEVKEQRKGNGYGYVSEKQGMSDTRFLENGKYFHDIKNEGKNGHFNNYENDKFEAVDDDDDEEEEEKYGHYNTNNYENGNGYGNGNGNGYVSHEKQGMSDTRFLENGKYFHDISEQGKKVQFNTNNNYNVNNGNFEAVDDQEEEKYGDSNINNNNYENENENENENGKYVYHAKNDHGVGDDVGFHHNNNVEFANSYYGNGNGNGNGNNEYGTQGRGRYNNYNYNGNNENHVKEGKNGGNTKKFPNEYDTMEEYDREQGYVDVHEDGFMP